MYHLNAVASSAFVSPPLPPVYSDGDPNVLLQRLSDRAEISKLTSSLASLDITVPDPDVFFATVSSLHTSTASGVTKDFLSKMDGKDATIKPINLLLNFCKNRLASKNNDGLIVRKYIIIKFQYISQNTKLLGNLQQTAQFKN